MYQCIICQHVNASTLELHNHHIENHSLEELSHAIINLQSSQSLNNPRYVKKKSLKPVKFGDNNNNSESICDHIVNNVKKEIKKKDIFYEEMQEANHNKEDCLIKCTQYIAWEQELYKKIKINDDEFFNVVECLCNDLKKRKRRGRKRKTDTMTEFASTSNFIQKHEDKPIVKSETQTIRKCDDYSTQSSRMTCNTESSIFEAVNNEKNLIKQIKEEPYSEDTDTELTFAEIEAANPYLTYDTTNNSFLWRSIIGIDLDGNAIPPNDTSASNVPQEIDSNNRKNFMISEST